jgi:hypothetical protein
MRGRAAFEAARPQAATHEELSVSVDALALAFRQACGNLGLNRAYPADGQADALRQASGRRP